MNRAEETQERRAALLKSLGGAWPEPCELQAEVIQTRQADGYRIESLRYQVEPEEWVVSLVLVPEQASKNNPAPAVAVWHQHNGEWHLGKSEPAGLAGNPMHHTGVALARLGYVVICPDAICFEDRQDPEHKLMGRDYERFEFLRYVQRGRSMAWKNILDMRRAIDLLEQRDDVDAERMGCYGHSMGSTHTWLVGPWETRLKCLVGNCCLPTYAGIEKHKLLHCFPNFVPGWSLIGDTPDIAALTAPRALHLNFGEEDGGSPIEEVRLGVKTIQTAYDQAGVSERFSYFIEPGTGHVLSDAMWQKTIEVFDRYLG